jgi:hypothetical protein
MNDHEKCATLFSPHQNNMKTFHPKKTSISRGRRKAMTFGELVAATYEACGDRAARKILQLAVNSEIVSFKSHLRHSIV